MTALPIGLACVAAIAAVVAVLAVLALRRARRDAAREAAALRDRLDALEAGLGELGPGAEVRAPGTHPEHQYVITELGRLTPGPLDRAGEHDQHVSVPARLTGPAFADAVLRETVVQTAALVHGLRRALAPETRNRIRFEMRRELKRSRKARRVEVKEALREYRARRRDRPAEAAASEGAA
jgi:hypothetical protein